MKRQGNWQNDYDDCSHAGLDSFGSLFFSITDAHFGVVLIDLNLIYSKTAALPMFLRSYMKSMVDSRSLDFVASAPGMTLLSWILASTRVMCEEMYSK